MTETSAEAWLTQEVHDLLGEGPVGLYEFVWGLNGTDFGLSRDEAIALSQDVARRIVSSGRAQIFSVQWPGFEVVDGPLSPTTLDDTSAWSEGTSGPIIALLPTT